MNDSKNAVVTTTGGRVEGSYEDNLYVFKGIPYAAPPVGKLRWEPPQPVKPWDGVRPAKKYGNMAPQNAMPFAMPGMPAFEEPQSEECLFLNIWTPGIDDAKRPVMFYIHGGAFIIGAGSEPVLKGGKLARRGDIVLVSINYRLGALGFLNLNEVTGSKIRATGNEGILDQIAALDWVQDNIAAFGGNPDDITIFGFSAGGMSVGTLLGIPLARGKFHKAMNRSGAANVVAPLDNAVKMSERYLELLDLTGRDADALRNLTPQQLLDGQQQLSMKVRETESRATPFIPVVDGVKIPEWPIDAIKKGLSKNIPVMAGNALDELKAPNMMMDPAMHNMNEAELNRRLNKLLPSDMVPGLINTYRDALKKRGSKADFADVLGTVGVDLMFRMTTLQLVEAQRDNGAPAYNYLFTYKSPAMGGVLGAMHGLDNPFLFGNLEPQLCGTGPAVENLAVKIQDSAIAFARNGNPSCESIGEWPVYGRERMTMILDKDTRVEAAPYEDERCAWEGYEISHTLPL